MSKSTAFLVAIIVLLVGALIYVIGSSTGSVDSRTAAEASAPFTASKTVTTPSTPPTRTAAQTHGNPNGARKGDGWNCDTHEANVAALGLEGYRLAGHEKAANGQDIEVWRNIAPRESRPPDRSDVIRVQRSAMEDCVIVEPDGQNE